MSWFYWALLSALFAAATAVLARVGVQQVSSDLATAIRTSVVLILASGVAWVTMPPGGMATVNRRAWVFLTLSGVATGLSWLCYFRALQAAPVAKVAPIDKLSLPLAVIMAALFLGERTGPKEWVGIGLVVAGTVVLGWK